MNTFSVAFIVALYSFAYYTAKVATTAAAEVAAPFENALFTTNLPYITMAGLILIGAAHDVFGAKCSMSLTHLGSASIYIGTYIVNMNISADATKYSALTSRAGTALQHTMAAASIFGAVSAHADSRNLKTKGAAAVKTLAMTSVGYSLGMLASAQALEMLPLLLESQPQLDMITATLVASISATVLALLITLFSSSSKVGITKKGGSWLSLLNPIMWLFVATVRYGRFWFVEISQRYDGASTLLPPAWPVAANPTFAIAANFFLVPVLLIILRGNVKLYLALVLLSASAISVLPLVDNVTLDATQDAMVGAACAAIAAMLYQAPNVVVANSVPFGAQGLAVAVGIALSGTAYQYGSLALQLVQEHTAPFIPLIAEKLNVQSLTADGSQGAITAAILVAAMLLSFMLPAKVMKRD